MAHDSTAKFSISLDGNRTGTKWHGEFTVKTMLSYNDEFRRDSIRRELLAGVNPQFAEPRVLNNADAFSELAVRITTAPAWWTESNGGRDLFDDNLIGAVYKEALAAEAKVLEAIKAAADAATANLRKVDPQA